MKKNIALILAAAGFSISANAFSGDEGKSYVSLHVGYGNEKVKQTFSGYLQDSTSKANKGLAQMAGIGYNLSNDFRTEASVLYIGKSKSKKSTKTTSNDYMLKNQATHIGGFVNAYYDIFSDTSVMPYVMGGLGFMKSEYKTELKGTPTDTSKKDRTKMAYQAGVGMDVHIGVGWTLDASYRIVNQLGSKKFNMPLTNGGSTAVSVRNNAINIGMVGLRMTF